MSDRYTSVTTQSWGSRLGGSLKGILFGLLLTVIAFPVLWWNEGRTVERHRALEEGAGLVIPVASEGINQGAEGRLIHTSGIATTQEILTDAQFGLSVRALQLRRTVSMYQWEEESESHSEKNLGGSETTRTTYSYKKVWRDSLIDSSGFQHPEGHQNPAAMPYPSQTLTTQSAVLGAFKLTPDQIGQLDNIQPASLAEAQIPDLGRPHQVQGNEVFLGQNPVKPAKPTYPANPANPVNLANPAIGDVRVTFTQMPDTEMSIIGRQRDGRILAYPTQSGGEILLVKTGLHSAEAMFKAAEAENRIIAWLLRALGFGMLWLGFKLLMNPLAVLADVVPFIGTLVSFGTGAAALVIALPLALMIAALAWVFYRPLLGVGLIIVAIVIAVLLTRRGRKRVAAAG